MHSITYSRSGKARQAGADLSMEGRAEIGEWGEDRVGAIHCGCLRGGGERLQPERRRGTLFGEAGGSF